MSEIESKGSFALRRQLLQMQTLYEIGVAINESLDPTYVAQEILQRAVVMVDARGGLLLVRNEEEEGFEVVGQLGLEEEPEGILQLEEVEEAWRQNKRVQKERDAPAWRHLCIVPLESRQEVKGLLIIADRESRHRGVGPFTENDQALLHSFAYQAGAALHNARLHHHLEEAYEQLQIAQRQLAQLEQLRALGDLAAEVVHTMSHILGIIIGRADMYLNFGKDPEKTVRTILETAESGQETIARIQQCTRLGVGKKREATDVSALLLQAVEETQALWPQRTGGKVAAVEWQTRLGDLPETFVNQTDLQEGFINLLLNALEAMPEGGRLEVESREEDGRIVVGIRDTGTGMTEEVQQKIFQPFFTTKEEMGTGLGLSIVYRIVDDHGGEIEVESVPGEGTGFTLYLPVRTQLPPQSGEEDDGETGLDR